MSAQGFKNLIKSSTFIDESFQQLLKRSDQYRKSSKMSLDYMQTLYKVYETHELTFEKIFLTAHQESPQKSEKYLIANRDVLMIFQRIFSIQRDFGRKFGNNIKQAISMSSDLFSNYSNLIVGFQSAIRSYIKNEQALLQQGKRHFKNQKALLQSLQIYKASFTDVKLIYNNDEKVKRYVTCEAIYKNIMEQLKSIEERVAAVNSLKKQIAQNYKNIEYQFTSAIKIVGNRIITLAELFVFQSKWMFSELSGYLHSKSQEAIKIKWSLSFNQDDTSGQDILGEAANESNRKYPNFITYFASMKTMKPQFYPQILRLFNGFIRQISQKIERRKRSQKSLIEFILNYFKQNERIVLVNLKEINSYYDKNRKKISEIYGGHHMAFMKTFTIVFEKIIENGQILNKSISLKVKTIENIVSQSSRHMDTFLKEAKAIFERNSKKKQGKKNIEEDSIDGQALRLQMQEKSVQIQALIDSLMLKLSQSQAQLNIHLNGIINDMLGNALQLDQFCRQFHQDEFEQESFTRKYQAFQTEVDETIKAKITLFNDLSFASLLSEKDDLITFDPDMAKIQEFKKMKKPAEYDNQRQPLKKKESLEEKFIQLERKLVETPRKTSAQQSVQRSPDKSTQKADKMQKYEQFLMSKIAFQEGEKYVKSYACGLSDKIILTGRLFVTNQRLCFHSKFNPSNVFFGQTFIQIPRKDILKVEKRQNAIIFNNSISITTLNGQMFFTSFFQRNQAFDTICLALEVSHQDLMFEPMQQGLGQQEGFEQQQQCREDDLKEQAVTDRSAEIERSLEPLEFIQIHTSQYTFPGLNAYKFFKLFDSSNDLSYNRKTYKGFTMYVKELLDHKEIVMEDWSPNLPQYLNPSNIRQDCPLKFQKVCTSIIPVANSGIPLMPKQANLREECTLYFFSKDRYIMLTKVQNGGIPYCDYFNIRYKKVVETVAEDRCKVTVYYYIEFVQKTMMRSVIQNKSLEESKIASNRQETEVKKYLKYLEKMRARNSSNNECSKESLEEKINQLQREIQQGKEREEKQQSESLADKKSISKYRKWLAISLLLNILMIMIITTLL